MVRLESQWTNEAEVEIRDLQKPFQECLRVRPEVISHVVVQASSQ
jgi:hypothetical protein